MTAEALTDLEAIGAVEERWRELAVERGNAFVTPEWFRCWWRHYGGDSTPFVVVDRAEGGVRGVMPLALPSSGRPRVCRLAGANLGDHFHPVARPEDEIAVAAAAGEALAEAPAPWSVIGLDHVELERPWLPALAEATGVRTRSFVRAPAPLPRIDLSRHADWDAYLASRSSNLRQQVRRFERRLAKDHEVRLRRTESPGELQADLGTVFDLHDRRWEGQTSLSSETARAFHGDFAAAALERGWLRLWVLEVDGEPIAAWYGWRLGDRYAYYNSGFDPEHSALRPGLLLLAGVIRAALEEGAGEFDFLLGDESYKFRFAEDSRTVHNATVARAWHPAALAAGAEAAARGLGRRLPERVRRAGAVTRLARRATMGGRGRR
jgi:CelD/BcsL family acetyltransferase involved in cellulose biosynthesis